MPTSWSGEGPDDSPATSDAESLRALAHALRADGYSDAVVQELRRIASNIDEGEDEGAGITG